MTYMQEVQSERNAADDFRPAIEPNNFELGNASEFGSYYKVDAQLRVEFGRGPSPMGRA